MMSATGFAFALTPLENRVADHLARAVPRQAPAPVNVDRPVVGWRANTVVAGARTDGDHLRMREQQQGVGNGAFEALGLERPHERLRLFVGHNTKVSDIQHVHPAFRIVQMSRTRPRHARFCRVRPSWSPEG